MPLLPLACAALLLTLGACASHEPASDSTLSFESLTHEVQSGFVEPQTFVLRSDYSWKEAWKIHARGRLPVPPTPAVSFQTEMVVGVALGSRPTPGYSIEIVRLHLTRDDLRVVYRDTEPEVDLVGAQVLTAPIHFVSAPHFDGEVIFERAE